MSIDCCDYARTHGRNCPDCEMYIKQYGMFQSSEYHTLRNDTKLVVDDLPVVMFSTIRQRLCDFALDMVCWTGTATLVVIVFACVVFITFFAMSLARGLYRIF